MTTDAERSLNIVRESILAEVPEGRRVEVVKLCLALERHAGDRARERRDNEREREDDLLALATRELLCEVTYHRRALYDAEHPARSLDLRGIAPSEVRDALDDLLHLVPGAGERYLHALATGDTSTLKQLGAAMVQLVGTNRAHPGAPRRRLEPR